MSEKLPHPETVTGATRRLQELVPIQADEDPFDWLTRAAAQHPAAAALIVEVKKEWAGNLWRLDHPGAMPEGGPPPAARSEPMTARSAYDGDDGPVGTEGRYVMPGANLATHVSVQPDAALDGGVAVVVAGRIWEPDEPLSDDPPVNAEIPHGPAGARTLAGLIWDAADEATPPDADELANRLVELARIVRRYGEHARTVGAPASGRYGGAEALPAGLESWAARIQQWQRESVRDPDACGAEWAVCPADLGVGLTHTGGRGRCPRCGREWSDFEVMPCPWPRAATVTDAAGGRLRLCRSHAQAARQQLAGAVVTIDDSGE